MDFRLLRKGDARLLERVAPDLFDHNINHTLTAEFLADPRHHLAIAYDPEAELVVGFASAIDYIHPDKPAELWINEVGVSPAWQRQGIASRLLKTLFDFAEQRDITSIWVATEPDNEAANALYQSAGGNAEPSVVYTFELPSNDN